MSRASMLFFALVVLAPVQADTVWLKNGGAIDGKVIKETSDRVVVETGAGKVTLDRSQVDRIERSGQPAAPAPPPDEDATPEPAPPKESSEPPSAEPPVRPDDEDALPEPQEVRLEKATVYARQGRLYLQMKAVQPKGAAIRLLREECRVESWTDDAGTEFSATGAEFSGFSMFDGPEGDFDARIDGEPAATATSCHVTGTIAYRLGWEAREGQVDPVELTEGTGFEIEGIPFTLTTPERPFASEEELKTRTWIELRCPFGAFQPVDFGFLTDLGFFDEGGKEIPSRQNQASDWSDMEGNAGFFFTYDIEGKPTVASIRYKLWSRMGTMTVPFDVNAPIKR